MNNLKLVATSELWEINQGKRLIKRLQKCGVKPGREFAFLLHTLQTAAATVAVDQAKGEGKTPGESTEAAMVAMASIKSDQTVTGHIGRDLYNLLVKNGAAPGRVKAELDKVLYVAGVTN